MDNVKNLRPKQIGVIGFLTEDGLLTYRKCSSSALPSAVSNELSDIMAKGFTKGTQEALNCAIFHQASQLKRRFPEANTVTVATPAADILTDEQLAELNLERFSLCEVIAEYCHEKGFNRVGLLGTEWDTADTSPLSVALESRHIESYEPSILQMRNAMTACVLNTLRGWIPYDGKNQKADKFCADVILQLLHDTARTIDALVICNPELRQLMFRTNRHLKQQLANIPVIDVAGLHWKAAMKL